MTKMTRRHARAWLAPMRRVINEIRQAGEALTHRGYPVTVMPDGTLARVNYCCAGFRALIARLCPDIDTAPILRIERHLANGLLLTVADLDACLRVFRKAEDALVGLTVADVVSATTTEQIIVEAESLGLIQEAA